MEQKGYHAVGMHVLKQFFLNLNVFNHSKFIQTERHIANKDNRFRQATQAG